MPAYFAVDDKEKATALLKFIVDKAKWDVDTREAMDLNKHLLWLQGLIPKINDNILELQRVIDPEKPAAPKKGK